MAYPVGSGEGPIMESLNAILTDCFFEIIEVSWIKDASLRRRAGELLTSSGIEVRYGAYPRLLSQSLSLNCLDEHHRRRAVVEMCDGIDEALELGAKQFGLMSGPYEGDVTALACMNALEQSLVEICAYASRHDVKVLLEPFDRTVDKKCLIGPVDTVREISERVAESHQNFGLIIDLSHIPLLGESPSQALRPVAKYVSHAHIGNCCLSPPEDPAYGDKHPRFGYPNGVNDVNEIAEFMQELFRIGYLQCDGNEPKGISFEIKPIGDENSAVMIAGAKRKLCAAWNHLATTYLSGSRLADCSSLKTGNI